MIGLLIVAIVVVFGLSQLQRQPDDGAMSRLMRNFIALYLLVLAGALAYLVIAFYAIDFPEAQITPVAAPDLSDKRPGEGPILKQIDPSTLVTSAPPGEVKVYGYHFRPESKVRFNGAEHETHYVGEHLLTAPLQSSDLSNTHAIRIDVITKKSAANADATKTDATKTDAAKTNATKTDATKTDAAKTDATKADADTSDPLTMLVVSPRAELTINTWTFQVSRELQLLLLVLVAGALGSYVHAIKSLAAFVGNQTAKASWSLWYVTRPFLGMALALIFYAVIRGGFVAGSPADVRSVNPFGVVALAALVGMFADTATQKLGEIFDTLFKTQAQNKDPLAPLEITTAALPDGTVNTPYALQLTARGAGPNASWTAQGLPAGFVLDVKTGLLHGTTAAALPATPISITLADGSGHSAHKTLMLTVH